MCVCVCPFNVGYLWYIFKLTLGGVSPCLQFSGSPLGCTCLGTQGVKGFQMWAVVCVCVCVCVSVNVWYTHTHTHTTCRSTSTLNWLGEDEAFQCSVGYVCSDSNITSLYSG